MPNLLQISIGPVQSFIKGARRTRDLKFSSSFLSTLARTAAQTLAETCGADKLIFPAMSAGQLDDVPNKILVYVEVDISPDELALSVKKRIDDRVIEIRKAVFYKIGKGQFHRKWAEQQIDDLVEYVWAAVEFEKQTDDYAHARQKLEALMAARKNTRNFAPVSWGSSQPKSSIDGQLESVIEENEYPRLRDVKNMSADEKRQVELQIARLRKSFDVGPHEKLSGVDLLKRLGPISEGTSKSPDNEKDPAGNHTKDEEKAPDAFPSTSHIAALPFLSGLKNLPDEIQPEARKRLNEYRDNLSEKEKSIPSFHLDRLPRTYRDELLGVYDGALLYPERFPNVVGDTQVFQAAREEFQEATTLLEELLQTIHMRPNPYYALLVADGDSMGKVIDHEAKSGMERHKKLSLALAEFATSVREIIEKNDGIRIYSGGDDVLAMLPLHTAVKCAHALANEFQDKLKDFRKKDGTPSTLSAGLAIVHHLHPLGEALEIARAAEKRAKRGEKNALAITLQKRGGPPCFVSGQWDTLVPRLQRQMELCQDELLPSGLAYELEEIALRLKPQPDEKEQEEQEQDGKAQERPEEPKLSLPHVQYAALRVLQRKLAEAGRREKKQEAALALYALKRMIGLIGSSGEPETPAQALDAMRKLLDPQGEKPQLLSELQKQTEKFDKLEPVQVGELADELVVARFFAEARRLAQGNKKGGKKV